MLFTFLLVVHAIIAATLVTVVLMQKSEGGGLGMGGSPSGLMSARGAADFLTRATTVLATLFIGMSILLAVLAASRNTTATVDPTLARRAPETTSIPTQAPPAGTAPFAGGAGAAVAPANAAAAANGNSSVPLAQ